MAGRATAFRRRTLVTKLGRCRTAGLHPLPNRSPFCTDEFFHGVWRRKIELGVTLFERAAGDQVNESVILEIRIPRFQCLVKDEQPIVNFVWVTPIQRAKFLAQRLAEDNTTFYRCIFRH